MTRIEADQRTTEIPNLPTDLAERATYAMRHIHMEAQGDLEGTLATLVDDPVYELHPIGLKMTGKALVRLYYEHFFSEVRPHIADYEFHGYCFGETSLNTETTIRWRLDDGKLRDFRVMTVLPYAEGGISGERIYADDDFFRLLFGPFFSGLQPIAA